MRIKYQDFIPLSTMAVLAGSFASLGPEEAREEVPQSSVMDTARHKMHPPAHIRK